MFIPFSPHNVKLKESTIKELIEQKILKDEFGNNCFHVIAIDIKSEKRQTVDLDKYDEDDDDEEVNYKEIEVAEIMILVAIPKYGYYWLDQSDITF